MYRTTVKMKKIILIVTFSCLAISCFSQKAINQEIDDYLKETIKINEIPGSAVAVIKDGKVIHEQYYGTSKANQRRTAF